MKITIITRNIVFCIIFLVFVFDQNEINFLTVNGKLENLHNEKPVKKHKEISFLDDSRNLALNKPTEQSSNFNAQNPENFEAQNAVNGKKNTTLFLNSCSVTDIQMYPWWRVDLQEIVSVSKIMILNPAVPTYENKNIVAVVTAEIVDDVSKSIPKSQICGEKILEGEPDKWSTFNCDIDGRYVTIFSDSSFKTKLNNCETEVFGTITNYCESRLNKCNSESTICTNRSLPNMFECVCKDGYNRDSGTEHNKFKCVKNKNACKEDDNPCDEETTNCTELKSKPFFKCECKNGYIKKKYKNGKINQFECVKKNLCDENKCDPTSTVCKSQPDLGLYDCECLEGYERKILNNQLEKYTCVKIYDPCAPGNHKCASSTECRPLKSFFKYECVCKN